MYLKRMRKRRIEPIELYVNIFPEKDGEKKVGKVRTVGKAKSAVHFSLHV